MCACSLDHITPKRRGRMALVRANATIPRLSARALNLEINACASISRLTSTSRIVKERLPQILSRGQKK